MQNPEPKAQVAKKTRAAPRLFHSWSAGKLAVARAHPQSRPQRHDPPAPSCMAQCGPVVAPLNPENAGIVAALFFRAHPREAQKNISARASLIQRSSRAVFAEGRFFLPLLLRQCASGKGLTSSGAGVTWLFRVNPSLARGRLVECLDLREFCLETVVCA